MLGIPAIFAAAADEHIPGFPMAHSGLGAHPDVEVALRRALTELAQSRCVDIQGVREDLLPAKYRLRYLCLAHASRECY